MINDNNCYILLFLNKWGCIMDKEYELMSKKLQAMIKLDKYPVSVKLFENIDDVDKLLDKFQGKLKHCGMVYEVATKHNSFYATLDEYLCPRGATALGLIDAKLGDVPKVDPIINAVGYAPLDNSPFKPDVIVVYCTPIQAMNLTQLLRQTTGKRFNADFAGIQSLCSDIVAKPFISQQSNMSLGCNGSRADTDIKDEEVIIGLTFDDLKAITDFV